MIFEGDIFLSTGSIEYFPLILDLRHVHFVGFGKTEEEKMLQQEISMAYAILTVRTVCTYFLRSHRN